MLQPALILACTAALLLGGVVVYLARRTHAPRPRRERHASAKAFGTRPLSLGMERPMVILRTPAPSCACHAVRDSLGHTFDLAIAPDMPLPGCDREDCECRYERAVNRRRGERRVQGERRGAIRVEERGDRRQRNDRRRGTRTWDGALGVVTREE